jgi:hypothetical protein
VDESRGAKLCDGGTEHRHADLELLPLDEHHGLEAATIRQPHLGAVAPGVYDREGQRLRLHGVREAVNR